MAERAEPGGGSSVDPALLQAFEDVLDAAADRAIYDMPSTEFYPSMAEASQAAQDASPAYIADPVEGGFSLQSRGSGGPGNTAPDGTLNPPLQFLTRDSKQWRELRGEFKTWLSQPRAAVESLRPERYDGPLAVSAQVYAGLRQEHYPTDFGVAELGADHDDVVASMGDQQPPWGKVGEIESQTSAWSGQFVSALRYTYLDQLPSILSGQLILAGYLLGSLKISRTAVANGKSDAAELLGKVVNALEAGGGGGDLAAASQRLSVISGALGTAGAVAALIPGGQTIAGALGLASAATGLLSTVSGMTKGGEKEAVVSGTTAKEMIADLARQLVTIASQVSMVDAGLSAKLGELSAAIGETGSYDADGPAGMTLSKHDHLLRPKPPTGEACGGHTFGGDSENEVFTAVPAYLGDIGEKIFPGMADEYRRIGGISGGAADGLEPALVRPAAGAVASVFPGNVVIDVGGTLLPAWTELHGQLSGLLAESATNLDAVGQVVVEAAGNFGGTDGDNAHNLQQTTR